MKKILSGILILLFMATVGYCETNQMLGLTIKSDQQVYQTGDEINIEASISNAGKEEAKIYSPDYWGVSDVIVTNSKGENMKANGVKVERVAFDHFLTIPAGETRTHIFENMQWYYCGGMWVFTKDAQLPSDRYKIFVTVTNPPVNSCDDNGKFYEKVGLQGTIVSNTITIEVKEKKDGSLATYPMDLKFNYDGKKSWWTFKLGDQEFYDLENMKTYIKTLPAGSRITWAPSDSVKGDEPLRLESDIELFKKFCEENRIVLVIFPGG